MRYYLPKLVTLGQTLTLAVAANEANDCEGKRRQYIRLTAYVVFGDVNGRILLVEACSRYVERVVALQLALPCSTQGLLGLK